MIKLTKLKTNVLTVPNWNPRKDVECSDLVESIRTQGLLHPLLIDRNNNVISGSRRLKALKELGIEEVDVYVSDKSDTENRLDAIDDNLVRQPLDTVEFEEALLNRKHLYELIFPESKAGISGAVSKHNPASDKLSFAASTAKILNRSKKTVERIARRAEEASERVKNLRKQGKLKPSQVDSIVRLQKPEQDQLCDSLVGLSTKETELRIAYALKHGAHNTPPTPEKFVSPDSLEVACNTMFVKVEKYVATHGIATVTAKVEALVVKLNFLLESRSGAMQTQRQNSERLEVPPTGVVTTTEEEELDYREFHELLPDVKLVIAQLDVESMKARGSTFARHLLDLKEKYTTISPPGYAFNPDDKWAANIEDFAERVISALLFLIKELRPNTVSCDVYVLTPKMLAHAIYHAARNYQVELISREEVPLFVRQVIRDSFADALSSDIEFYVERALSAYDRGVPLRRKEPKNWEEAWQMTCEMANEFRRD